MPITPTRVYAVVLDAEPVPQAISVHLTFDGAERAILNYIKADWSTAVNEGGWRSANDANDPSSWNLVDPNGTIFETLSINITTLEA